MKQELSDEQVDLLMRRLMTEAGDNEAIDEIAASSVIWWSIQRNIKDSKTKNRLLSILPWPPEPKLWRIFLIGAPSTLATILLIVAFVQIDIPKSDSLDTAFVAPQIEDRSNLDDRFLLVTPSPTEVASSKRPRNPQIPTSVAKLSRKRLSLPADRRANPSSSAEVKSDFIALSYAGNPESGQIVRVKVPSSMMVSLGLVASVEKPSRLVNAEVVVGDDGLTHSIRFIR